MIGLHHPTLYRNRSVIETLDPVTDYLQIYQRTVLYDFRQDTMVGLQFAFYRVFAAPRIAEVLHRSGEMHRRSRKRAYDTALVMYELIANGFDSERGRDLVRMLNRVHRGWGIVAEDYRYVLTSFIVTPIRWIEQHGWRALLPAEREAATRFYVELGRRMKIVELPTSYAEAVDIVDQYEREHFAPSEASHRLMEVSVPLLIERLPRVLRRHPKAAASAVFNEARLSSALGLPPPAPHLVRIIRLMLAARNLVRRFQPALTEPWFSPGQPVGLYPHGYQLQDLGPEAK